MSDEPSFIGGATIYRGGRKVGVVVCRHHGTDAEGVPDRWWGTYEVEGAEPVGGGAAYARFSDGSEADIVIEPADDRRGSFVVTSPLADSTTRPRPDV